MAKRFVDTRLGKDVWFRRLKPKMKCAWRFLCDECDSAGVWAIDMEAMEFYIGEPITQDELFSCLNTPDKKNRIEPLPGEKIYITDFIHFQYGNLSENSPAHKPIFFLIKKHNLFDKVFNRVSNTLQEKEMEKETEMEMEKVEEGVLGEGESSGIIPVDMISTQPVLQLMKKEYKKIFPNEPDHPSDFRSLGLIANDIRIQYGWDRDAHLKHRKDELIAIWIQLVKHMHSHGFYSTLTLETLAGKNSRGLIKNFLNPKINGNGKHADLPSSVGRTTPTDKF